MNKTEPKRERRGVTGLLLLSFLGTLHVLMEILLLRGLKIQDIVAGSANNGSVYRVMAGLCG